MYKHPPDSLGMVFFMSSLKKYFENLFFDHNCFLPKSNGLMKISVLEKGKNRSPITARSWGDRSFCVAAPGVWNTLPREIATATSLQCFKTGLKTYLFKRSY